MPMKKKLLVVFGTRPEAIKMAPVINQLKQSQKIDAKICVTGQHRSMLDQVLNLFELKPEFDLNIMDLNQDLTDITSKVLHGMRRVLKSECPDMVLVHGDTTTAMAASLAAFYERIKISHVEAGLRTTNIYSPWPEEINRRIITKLASHHFAPTKLAKENLLREGCAEDSITVTGNTVIDALLYMVKKIKKDHSFIEATKIKYNFFNGNQKLILVTGHRRENFGAGFNNVFSALAEIADRRDVRIIYPVHLNPNVKNKAEEILGNSDRVSLIEPLDYKTFVYFMMESTIIITDSGGIQEEAPSLGKPVLVTRESTERPEAIHAGNAKLVGTDKDLILAEATRLLDDKDYFNATTATSNPFGDGKAARAISTIIESII
jgi:UDP-N-acetylglucosamine 2-epimerase (non-hydrolysing)